MKKNLTILLFALVSHWSLQAQDLKPVDYQDGDQKLNGLVTSNAGQSLPGVLILPAWRGIDQEAKTAALELEKQGYSAFIADIYGQGNIPSNNEEAGAIATRYRNDYKAYQHRIALAFEQLKKSGADPERIAVIGYCFGGGGALEAARAGLKINGAVSIHGYYYKDADRKNDQLNAKILVEHAANDQTIRREDLDKLIVELNESKADWQLIKYANTLHTFTDPQSPDYHQIMAKRAWDHTLLFLKEVLKK